MLLDLLQLPPINFSQPSKPGRANLLSGAEMVPLPMIDFSRHKPFSTTGSNQTSLANPADTQNEMPLNLPPINFQRPSRHCRSVLNTPHISSIRSQKVAKKAAPPDLPTPVSIFIPMNLPLLDFSRPKGTISPSNSGAFSTFTHGMYGY